MFLVDRYEKHQTLQEYFLYLTENKVDWHQTDICKQPIQLVTHYLQNV